MRARAGYRYGGMPGHPVGWLGHALKAQNNPPFRFVPDRLAFCSAWGSASLDCGALPFIRGAILPMTNGRN